MRICIVAEHASMRFGGEASLPYHWFRVLRGRGIEAWLVVHARTRDELLAAFPGDIDRILFVEDMLVHKLLFRLSRPLPRRVAGMTTGLANQLITQISQRRIVRRLVREHGIDVVHQPIPVSPRYPSLLRGLGAPLVVGPMNGGMTFPPAFRDSESWLTRHAVALGRRLSGVANRILPGKLHAAVLLVANQRTREALPSGLSGRVVEMPENGVDLARFDAPAEDAPMNPKRFVYIGRLVDLKQVNIAVDALALAPGAILDVFGEGPMLRSWKQLADRRGLADRVRFHGWMPQADCAEQLRSAAALVLPSVCESGGAVVLEAMATGKPVIAARWGGPADSLDETCGFLVEPSSPRAMIEGFAHAMRQLMASPALGRQLGAAGREKILRDYDWEKKLDQMLPIYESAAK